MNNTFYTPSELPELGLKCYGSNIQISRRASIYSPENIEIGDNVRIDDFCILSGGGGIKLGSFIHIAPFCGLYGGSGIEIGDFAGLSSRTALYSESDDFSGESLTNPTVPVSFKPKYQRGKIVICAHGILGTNSTVLPGVHIAEGAAICAHSLVFRNCKSWSIYGGNPAIRLKERSQMLLKQEEAFRNAVKTAKGSSDYGARS